MTTAIENLVRKRGDTCSITFVVTDALGVLVDISTWTSFLLTVDPLKAPVDANANIFQITGIFVTDGTDGKISFSPPGTGPVGSYYYDVQAIDASTRKCTIVEGKYKITQDVTKD